MNAGLACWTAATRVEVRIVDEDGTALSRGEIGSLEVKGIMFSKAIGNCPKKLRPSSMTNGLSLATWPCCLRTAMYRSSGEVKTSLFQVV